jgi:hypothetical protein
MLPIRIPPSVIARAGAVLLIAATGLALAIVGVGLHDTQGVSVTPTDTERNAAGVALFDIYACREEQFRSVVPQGASVYIDETSDEPYQRLAEFASSWAIPTTNRSMATVVVHVVGDPNGCGGVSVVAEPQ